MIKISVTIPAYNGEKYIRAAMDSLIGQSLQEWECIVFDNASSDNSKSIIKEYAEKDKRFRLIESKENLGASAGRNAGIDAAKGEYVTFLDQDDLFDPRAFESLYAAAKLYDADMVFGNMTVVEDDFKISKKRAKGSGKVIVMDNPQKKFHGQIPGWCYVWNKIFRREKLGAMRFYEELYPCEDTHLVLRFAPACNRIVHVDAATIFWRKSTSSFTHNEGKLNPRYIRSMATMLLLMDKAISENPDWEKSYKKFVREAIEKPLVIKLLRHGDRSETVRLKDYRMRSLSPRKKLAWRLFKTGLADRLALVLYKL
ncbi:MAG: glycosyltransferase [Alphaproteobacteria bacterium]|nr:glycosyltransferase [Alphaproteobacteria bacterium]